MRLAALTALAMVAFAANSVLNRAALADGLADPLVFAAIRTLAGAATLAALVAARRTPRLPPPKPAAAAALALYMLGFSLAYLALDTGTGALLLFGTVQVTMAAAALAAREPVPARRWAGTALAFAGLIWLLQPAGTGGQGLWALAMAAAGFGWGLYTLMGRGARDPLAETASNFLLAAPLTLAALALTWPAGLAPTTPAGLALAIVSGAVTSGLGYALWYAVLPALARSSAALAQLTVPVIAAAGGLLLLGESPTPRLVGAGLLVVGGVALGLVPARAARR